MNGRLAYLRERLETSIWVIPFGLCLACAGLALGMLWLDQGMVHEATTRFVMPVAAARQILGVIAGSIIGVGGVAFSVTMVALTLTSGQYGPRIIRHFLEDNVSKLSLGLFLGVFVYALVVATGYATTDSARYSVLGAVLLALLALAGFVAFVHRTATDLQADRIIERIGEQLRAALEALLDAPGQARRAVDTLAWRRTARGRHCTVVRARRRGYVQAVDHRGLTACCAAHDCCAAARVRAGDFVVEGSDVLHVYGDAAADETLLARLEACIVTGPARTPVQDPEYAITQLVQLAARALSPGINDPGTAITCIDWFSLALARIVDQELPGSVFFDDEDVPRLLARGSDFAGIVKAGFAPLRQFARGDVAVSISLLEALTRLAALTRRDDRREVLLQHGRLIHDAFDAREQAAHDLGDLRQRYHKLCRTAAP